MATYRDDAQWQRGGVLCGHLVADSLGELHDFAARLGLPPSHFQPHALTPHYTLPQVLHGAADALGACALDRSAFNAVIARLNAGGDPPPPSRRGRGQRAANKARCKATASRPVRTPEQPALL